MVSFKTFGWRIVELFTAEQQDRALRTTISGRHLCFGPTLATQMSNQNKNGGHWSLYAGLVYLAVGLRITPQFSIQMF
jgi:hypothetical protein